MGKMEKMAREGAEEQEAGRRDGGHEDLERFAETHSL